MAAGRRREVEREFAGRVRFERRAFILVSEEGQRPAYDDYVISHRVRAAEMMPELGFAIPRRGQPYPRSSWNSQLLALQTNCPPALEDALFGAMFRELQDLSDPEVLRACARKAGLDEAEVDRALASPALRERARREHLASEEFAITGIPAVVIPGTRPLVGAVPAESYRQALRLALDDHAS